MPIDANIKHRQATAQGQDIEWKTEVFRVAGFVKDYWVLLGSGVLILSVIAMHRYLVEEGIPLSITSPHVVTGLPTLFILITYAVASLTCSAALPSAILLSQSKALGRSLLDDMHRNSDSEPCDVRGTRVRLTVYWSLGVTIPATVVVVVLLYWPIFIDWMGAFAWFVTAVLLFVMSVALVTSRMLPQDWITHIKAKWGIFVGCCTVQAFIMLSLAAIVESQVSSGFIELLVVLIFAMFALSVFQIVSAWSLWDAGRKPRPIVRAGGIAGVVMLVVCTMPPLNQFFVGYVMTSSVTGGRGCTVFIWSEGAKVLPELRSRDDGSRSVNLRVPMASHGIFYSRPWQSDTSKEIALIPYANVAKVIECDS